MKAKLSLIFLIFSFFSGFAQDQDIVGTWYVRAFVTDLEPDQNISNNSSIGDPTLVIDADYSFTGLAGCNTFSGQFVYDAANDRFATQNFATTMNTCDLESQTYFENSYYYELNDSGPNQIFSDGFDLNLWQGAYFGMVFQKDPFLGTTNYLKDRIKIYPNPVTEKLYISSETNNLKEYAIYSSLGNIVLEGSLDEDFIDVSELSKGVYFLKVFSEEGNIVKRLLKD